MSGLDKIIEHITQEAGDEAERIISGARSEAQSLLEAGKKEALNRAEAIKRQSELDAAAARKRIKSASELQEKKIILQKKQDMIEAVFVKAVNRLTNLDDEEYFRVLSQMIARYATGEKGIIRLSERDLSRVSPSFKKVCEEAGLSLSEKCADIPGGFILVYDDIEENCSFDVLISASREELQDRIGQLMFG